jgi:hypothetical protein
MPDQEVSDLVVWAQEMSARQALASELPEWA